MNTLDQKTRFLWLDVETTGLDPQRDLLLEVAWWPSRSADPFDLDPADQRSVVIRQPGDKLGAALSPFTWAMHCKNGLLPEVVSNNAIGTGDLEERLAETVGIKMNALYGGEKPEHIWHLAGNSVHFDHNFLKASIPAFAKSALSHRILDVSAVMIAARSLGLDIPKAEPAHRALDDVKQSIDLYRRCVSFFVCGFAGR